MGRSIKIDEKSMLNSNAQKVAIIQLSEEGVTSLLNLSHLLTSSTEIMAIIYSRATQDRVMKQCCTRFLFYQSI